MQGKDQKNNKQLPPALVIESIDCLSDSDNKHSFTDRLCSEINQSLLELNKFTVIFSEVSSENKGSTKPSTLVPLFDRIFRLNLSLCWSGDVLIVIAKILDIESSGINWHCGKVYQHKKLDETKLHQLIAAELAAEISFFKPEYSTTLDS